MKKTISLTQHALKIDPRCAGNVNLAIATCLAIEPSGLDADQLEYISLKCSPAGRVLRAHYNAVMGGRTNSKSSRLKRGKMPCKVRRAYELNPASMYGGNDLIVTVWEIDGLKLTEAQREYIIATFHSIATIVRYHDDIKGSGTSVLS